MHSYKQIETFLHVRINIYAHFIIQSYTYTHIHCDVHIVSQVGHNLGEPNANPKRGMSQPRVPIVWPDIRRSPCSFHPILRFQDSLKFAQGVRRCCEKLCMLCKIHSKKYHIVKHTISIVFPTCKTISLGS